MDIPVAEVQKERALLIVFDKSEGAVCELLGDIDVAVKAAIGPPFPVS